MGQKDCGGRMWRWIVVGEVRLEQSERLGG